MKIFPKAHFRFNRRVVIGLLGGSAALLLVGCGIVRSFPTYRYRLTVEVETPEGLKSGSSVIEVRTGAMNLGGIGGGVSADVSGQAVTIDLGVRGLLFALLRSEGNGQWAAGIMPSFTPRPAEDARTSEDDTIAIQIKNVLANKGLIVLPRMYPRTSSDRPSHKPQSAYPLLVRFEDIKNPESVTRVDPGNLARSFGPGVELKRVTVQITEDPVTTGIEQRLSWLQNHHGSLVKRPQGISIENMTEAERANEGDFIIANSK